MPPSRWRVRETIIRIALVSCTTSTFTAPPSAPPGVSLAPPLSVAGPIGNLRQVLQCGNDFPTAHPCRSVARQPGTQIGGVGHVAGGGGHPERGEGVEHHRRFVG